MNPLFTFHPKTTQTETSRPLVPTNPRSHLLRRLFPSLHVWFQCPLVFPTHCSSIGLFLPPYRRRVTMSFALPFYPFICLFTVDTYVYYLFHCPICYESREGGVSDKDNLPTDPVKSRRLRVHWTLTGLYNTEEVEGPFFLNK